MTFREFELKRQAYTRSVRDNDQRLRMLCYITARPYLKDQNMSIYEFMPLEGDPTPDEIDRIQKESLEKEMIEARKTKDEILTAFRNYGRV